MKITLNTIATTSDSFRDLFKRQRYETLVLDVLNKSQRLIQNLPLYLVEEQSNGECDFKDQVGTQYDAKLLIDKTQGALIGDRKNDLIAWFESMMDEVAEFSESIARRDLSLVSTTKLYHLMKERLKSVQANEVAVLFIPYPLVTDHQGSIYLQFATDFLQAVYNEVEAEGVISCKDVFFIYPSIEPDVVVLRNAKTRVREYISALGISEYIRYVVLPSVD